MSSEFEELLGGAVIGPLSAYDPGLVAGVRAAIEMARKLAEWPEMRLLSGHQALGFFAEKTEESLENELKSAQTRAARVAWAKERALAELDANGCGPAMASLVSDLNKSEIALGRDALAAMMAHCVAGDAAALRQVIEAT